MRSTPKVATAPGSALDSRAQFGDSPNCSFTSGVVGRVPVGHLGNPLCVSGEAPETALEARALPGGIGRGA